MESAKANQIYEAVSGACEIPEAIGGLLRLVVQKKPGCFFLGFSKIPPAGCLNRVAFPSSVFASEYKYFLHNVMSKLPECTTTQDATAIPHLRPTSQYISKDLLVGCTRQLCTYLSFETVHYAGASIVSRNIRCEVQSCDDGESGGDWARPGTWRNQRHSEIGDLSVISMGAT